MRRPLGSHWPQIEKQMLHSFSPKAKTIKRPFLTFAQLKKLSTIYETDLKGVKLTPNKNRCYIFLFMDENHRVPILSRFEQLQKLTPIYETAPGGQIDPQSKNKCCILSNPRRKPQNTRFQRDPSKLKLLDPKLSITYLRNKQSK